MKKQQDAQVEMDNELMANPKSLEFLRAIELAESSVEEEMEEP